MELWKTVDTWFLILMVVGLGAFFVWAVQYILTGLKQSIIDLGETFRVSINKLEQFITDLYEHKGDHETRISVLENVVGIPAPLPLRQSGGRRKYDPSQPLDGVES